MTRKDAAFNQSSSISLTFFIPFLLKVAGGLADEVGGRLPLLLLVVVG